MNDQYSNTSVENVSVGRITNFAQHTAPNRKNEGVFCQVLLLRIQENDIQQR